MYRDAICKVLRCRLCLSDSFDRGDKRIMMKRFTHEIMPEIASGMSVQRARRASAAGFARYRRTISRIKESERDNREGPDKAQDQR
jgi:hypothetical protein